MDRDGPVWAEGSRLGNKTWPTNAPDCIQPATERIFSITLCTCHSFKSVAGAYRMSTFQISASVIPRE